MMEVTEERNSTMSHAQGQGGHRRKGRGREHNITGDGFVCDYSFEGGAKLSRSLYPWPEPAKCRWTLVDQMSNVYSKLIMDIWTTRACAFPE